MYDFYANPPNSKKELREWLTSWLVKPSGPEPHIIEHNNEQFIEELGFRRAFYHHSVLRSISTGEYIWLVSDDMQAFPSKRFPDFETMLEGVIDDYMQWKLTG
jgi:hypothetical protein